MSFGGPKTIAQTLESGNDDLSFLSPLGPSIPSEDELMRKMDSFFSDQGGITGLPSRYRNDLNWLFDRMYRGADGPVRKKVVVGSAESVVVADGSRPVFFIENDALVPKGSPDGPFVDALIQRNNLLATASLSVGRLETEDFPAPENMDIYYSGTAFMVASDIIMTNRHVIETMVDQPTSAGPFTMSAEYWVNFDGQYGGGTQRRFRVDEIIYAGPDYIGAGGDFALLDLALLRIGAPLDASAAKPSPIALTGRKLAKDTKIAALGFPGRPQVYSGDGIPPAGTELETVMRDVFDLRFGYKRCAVGRVSTPVPGSIRDTKMWILAHDAATLGGSSGSPILALDQDRLEVSALHFFGQQRKANFAHVFDSLASSLTEFGIPLGS